MSAASAPWLGARSSAKASARRSGAAWRRKSRAASFLFVALSSTSAVCAAYPAATAHFSASFLGRVGQSRLARQANSEMTLLKRHVTLALNATHVIVILNDDVLVGGMKRVLQSRRGLEGFLWGQLETYCGIYGVTRKIQRLIGRLPRADVATESWSRHHLKRPGENRKSSGFVCRLVTSVTPLATSTWVFLLFPSGKRNDPRGVFQRPT